MSVMEKVRSSGANAFSEKLFQTPLSYMRNHTPVSAMGDDTESRYYDLCFVLVNRNCQILPSCDAVLRGSRIIHPMFVLEWFWISSKTTGSPLTKWH